MNSVIRDQINLKMLAKLIEILTLDMYKLNACKVKKIFFACKDSRDHAECNVRNSASENRETGPG